MKIFFKISALLFISISFLTISSCKKEDNKDSAPAGTEKSKITNKDFKMTDYNASLNGTPFMTYADIDACDKDDITRFLDDLSGTFDEGPTKCVPTDPQQTSFTWSLVSNDKQLRYDDNGDVIVFDIKINNGTTLKLESTEVDDFDNDGNNDILIETTTFTKQ